MSAMPTYALAAATLAMAFEGLRGCLAAVGTRFTSRGCPTTLVFIVWRTRREREFLERIAEFGNKILEVPG